MKQHDPSNWFHIEPRQDSWLVDGLIPSDSYTVIVGKPKAGKSTFLRSLISSIIKGRKFLGRSIEVPYGQARILYIHIDRKDPSWRVAKELRDTLGVTEDEAARIHLRTAKDMPNGWLNRLEWLKRQVTETRPTVIIIDLLWQFTHAKSANDYKEVLDSINSMQDALESIGYRGAVIATLHGRKATNPNDEADDALGSTAQRGSFANGIYLARERAADRYTIFTDQTIRDDIYGEIDKSVLLRNPDGTLELGPLVTDIAKAEKLKRGEGDLQRLLNFIALHPECEMDEIMGALSMSRKHAQALMTRTESIKTRGKGIKGDPLRYYVEGMEDGPSFEVQAAAIAPADPEALMARIGA